MHRLFISYQNKYQNLIIFNEQIDIEPDKHFFQGKIEKIGDQIEKIKEKNPDEYITIEQKCKTHLTRDPSFDKNTDNQEIYAIYCVAIPKGQQLDQFLKQIQKCYNGINCIRIIEEIEQTENNNDIIHKERVSLVIYFRNRKIQQEFYKQYNEYYLNENTSEILYLVELKEVRFFDKNIISIQDLIVELQLDYLIQLPTCPVCIESIDASSTGFCFQNIEAIFVYDNLERWRTVKELCSCCNIQYQYKTECEQCQIEKQQDLSKDIWICVICSNLGCGRYKFGHSVMHFQETGHQLSKDLQSSRIWDYQCDTFVHRILQDRENGVYNLPENQIHHHNSDQSLDKNNKESLESHIWEYCYIISEQMEEQRHCYEEQIQKLEENEIYSKEIQKYENQINQTAQNIELISKDKKTTQEQTQKIKKQIKLLQDKSQNLKKEIENIQVFKDCMDENIQQMEESKKNDCELPYQQEIIQEEQELEQLRLQFEQLASQFENQ